MLAVPPKGPRPGLADQLHLGCQQALTLGHCKLACVTQSCMHVPVLQCKPDPIMLERTQKMLMNAREDLSKQGVSGSLPTAERLFPRHFVGGTLPVCVPPCCFCPASPVLPAANPWPLQHFRCLPPALQDHSLQRAHKSACQRAPQIKNVKLTTLVSCVGGAHDIGRHINDYAQQNKVDMLVMGSRGLGGLRRTLLGAVGLGSISDYVVKHAPCNVVVHKMAPQPKPAAA
jgi:hypothetical protein